MNLKCYVTGKEEAKSYTFGPAVLLGLTDAAYAHYLLRSEKDAVHQEIVRDLAAKRAELQKIADEAMHNKDFGKDDDKYLDTVIATFTADDKVANLQIQQFESNVRILRQMREDYRRSGRLFS